MSLLADALKGLASISLQTVTEQTFANEIVRPYMEKVIYILKHKTTKFLKYLWLKSKYARLVLILKNSNLADSD